MQVRVQCKFRIGHRIFELAICTWFNESPLFFFNFSVNYKIGHDLLHHILIQSLNFQLCWFNPPTFQCRFNLVLVIP